MLKQVQHDGRVNAHAKARHPELGSGSFSPRRHPERVSAFLVTLNLFQGLCEMPKQVRHDRQGVREMLKHVQHDGRWECTRKSPSP